MSSITGNSDNIFVNNANLKIVKPGKGIIFADGSVFSTAPPNSDSGNTAYFSNGINAFVITETTANTGFAGNTAPTDAISVSSNLFISYTGNLITIGQITAGSVANVESNILTLESDLLDNSSRIGLYESSIHLKNFNVGINPSDFTPSANLHVVGNAYVTGNISSNGIISVFNSGADAGIQLLTDGGIELLRSSVPYIDFKTSSGIGANVRIQHKFIAGSNALVFYSGDDFDSDVVSIRENGAISVGTTDSYANLYCRGDSKFFNSSGQGNFLHIDPNSYAAGPAINATYTNGTSKSLLLNPIGGNVGIGETTPSAKLHVNGNAYVTSTLDGTPFRITKDTFMHELHVMEDHSYIAGTQYYNLATLGTSISDMHLSGYIGEHDDGVGMSSIDLTISNRSGVIRTAGHVSGFLGDNDILIYKEVDNTANVYIKVTEFCVVNLTMKAQVDSINYDGTYSATTPTGTLYWTASTDAPSEYFSNVGMNFNGNVGIGTTAPAKKLEIQTTGSDHLRLQYSAGYFWDINRNINAGELYFASEFGTKMNLTTTGYLTIAGTYSPFTGSHTAINSKVFEDGSILISTGTEKESIINTSFYVDNSMTAKDKRVVGVAYTENYFTQNTNVNSIQIVALGEGQMLVCNENGDIENGDYICSSNVAGHGMKQDDDLLHNYTVAKATEDCSFTGPDDKKLISETFHCG